MEVFGGEFMVDLVEVCFACVNRGLAIGLMFAALLLLRPLLKRLITPGQRVILWVAGWLPAYLSTWYGMLGWLHILPVTFRDLITPRVDSRHRDLPAYLPGTYSGSGSYNLAMPGGAVVQVELDHVLLLGAACLWLAGIAAVGIIFWRKNRAVRRLLDRGEAVSWDSPELATFGDWKNKGIQVRLCDGLDTSFLYWGHGKGEEGVQATICLQRELSPERLDIVLRHELKHYAMRHHLWKFYANFAIAIHWYNPLVWLAHKYFCQDLELACDRAVLEELGPERRKEYAKTLVELAAGRQLWDAPLGFGECDAQVRVREAVAWKKTGWAAKIAKTAVFVLLVLFFVGGPQERQIPQDILLTWQSQGGTLDTLAADVESHLADFGTQQAVAELWCAPGTDRYEAVVYARLADGSWRSIDYFYINADRMYFGRGCQVKVEPEPDLRDAYRLK